MDTTAFLNSIEPGNYFITKSMELTKSQSSGTLWYTKKFIVLYNCIFLGDNITTIATARQICDIFNSYIDSLPQELQPAATDFFYATADVADLRSDRFRLFDDFAGQRQFVDDNERAAYFDCAKKYYFAFLMESGGQTGVKAHIKAKLYEPEFVYSDLDGIIADYAGEHGCGAYNSPEAYIRSIRNDYMAFIRNERQILFYYGFFHSKSSGSNDKEFSSLTPIGELAIHSNYYELIALWEHQKIKMLSQPVNIEIRGLENSNIGNPDNFAVNRHPYLTILKSLQRTGNISKDAYRYVVSRLPEYPDDGIDTSAQFINRIRAKVNGFNRRADNTVEDFNKELLKYILGIRSDLAIDRRHNPLGLCSWSGNGVTVTDRGKTERLLLTYSVLSRYKEQKYGSLFQACADELKRQYKTKAAGEAYILDPRIKIDWDMYNIHVDFLILLATAVLILEAKNTTTLTKDTIDDFADGIRNIFPEILRTLGLSGKAALRKELKNIINVYTDESFDMYLNEKADEYEPDTTTAYLNDSLADLKRKINDESAKPATYVNGIRKRNTTLISLIKSYNLQKYSAGDNALRCECCGNTTFITYKNESYVEYHHIIPFSRLDGPDHELNIVALCPVCHRKLHFIRLDDKQQLYNGFSEHSYNRMSVEKRMSGLFDRRRLKSYQIEFLLADNAINEDAYNRILRIAE